MSRPVKKQIFEKSSLLHCGLLSKRDAQKLIAQGYQHIHSSILAATDIEAKRNTLALNKKPPQIPTFGWELPADRCNLINIKQSGERKKILSNIFHFLSDKTRQSQIDRTLTVLEEILSNAIFHSIKKSNGEDAYSRMENVTLSDKDSVELQFAIHNNGFFARIIDSGGSLNFQRLQSCFSRCSENANITLEDKQGGAGIGFYMIFELVQHLKILVSPNKQTEVSFWINFERKYDPDIFSFNFFKGA